MDHPSDRLLLTAQLAVGVAAVAIMCLYPPANGRILLVPVTDHDVNAVARLALSSGAALLGEGPLPGSLVVVGSRARLSGHTHPWQVLMLAAPPAGCSGNVTQVIEA